MFNYSKGKEQKEMHKRTKIWREGKNEERILKGEKDLNLN